MKRRSIERHGLAREDVRTAVEFYLGEAGDAAALDFVEAVDNALTYVAEFPTAGSPRLGQELGLPGVRSWSVKRFPYIIFYLDHGDRIVVWRVLHSQRDLPNTLADFS